uniref:RING-type domain-containing protein n=1 Tax=Angiostrongylus cantonensis TaxID=6313 RepID=A0A0K0DBG7_ANGCA
MHSTNDDSFTDDGCSICYEDYTSAGEHRLASIKCGHFFGYSCITRWIRTEGFLSAVFSVFRLLEMESRDICWIFPT